MCTKVCPCDITDKTQFTDLTNKKIMKSGYKTYLECPTQTLSTSHKYKYASLLGAIENQYNCAGIC